MLKKFLAHSFTLIMIYALSTEVVWACSDSFCNVAALDTYLKEKILYPMMILGAGIALTIAIVRNDGAENNPTDPALAGLGRNKEAETLLRCALKHRESTAGKNSEAVARVATHLAAVLRATKRNKEAAALENRAKKIRG